MPVYRFRHKTTVDVKKTLTKWFQIDAGESAMKARQMIEGSIFEPETLHVASKAFDAAWEQIAHHFDGDAEQARLQLAHAILVVTKADSTDAERVKKDALEVMALAYRG